jgi:hypothetical protein
MTQPDEELQERLLQLIDELIRSTENGHVSWKETDAAETYLYSTLGTAVTIGRARDGTSFVLRVLNRSGTVVASLRTSHVSVHLGSISYSGPDNAVWDQPLADLYAIARSNALNPKGVIDDLLGDLHERRSDPS